VNIRKKSKSLLGLSTGARRSCLKKKTRGKKSRGTVPLSAKNQLKIPIPWKTSAESKSWVMYLSKNVNLCLFYASEQSNA
jgi:hypothetical protein